MDIVQLKLDEFREYKGNPRKNDHAVEKMAQSIKEFGFRVPLLIKRDNTIIDGHLRLKAARKAGLTDIPAVYVDDLSDAQIKAFRIAINRMAELAEWDEALLGVELQELRELDFDLDLTGFDTSDIDDLIASSDSSDITEQQDIVDPPPIQAKSKLGDVWICGKHRVMCGDWLNPAHRDALMLNAKADMVFTDPPYNAAYVSRVHRKPGNNWGKIANDDMDADKYSSFIDEVFSCLTNHIITTASIYACINWKSYPILAKYIGDYFVHKSTIIWNKGSVGLGDRYRTQFEMILYAVWSAESSTWNSEHDEKDVWNIVRIHGGSYQHPTQKPVELAERAILNSSKDSDIILDIFCGSGSTLAACLKNNRRCYTMDIEPKYVDIAVQRYQNLTGQKAILEATGEFYDDREVQDGQD